MSTKNKYQISDLSPHLFWDVNETSINWQKHDLLIVERVLQHGLLSDWKILLKLYSFDRIVAIARNIRNLDAVSLNFISILSGLKEKEFKCYSGRQLNPTLWNS